MKIKKTFKTDEGKKAVIAAYDSVLKQWPVPNENLYVGTRHGNTFIIAGGEKAAPPLILLHGTSMNSAMWIGDITAYSADHRVYAVDIPGEPGKSEDTQFELAGPAYAEWLNDVFEGLGLSKASIAGISLGAWMAVKFAAAFPEKVEKLVLLSPSGIGAQKVSFLFRALPYMLMGEKGMDKLARYVNGNQAVPDEMLQYQRIIAKNFNLRGRIPLFNDDELKRLTMPVLLFAGENDVLLHSRKTASRMGELLPHAGINLLPDAGHVLVNLTDRIIRFLG